MTYRSMAAIARMLKANRTVNAEIARCLPHRIERTCLTGTVAEPFVPPIDLLYTALPPWAERAKRKRSVSLRARLFALSDGAVY